WLPAIVASGDIVMGFGPPEGDAAVTAALCAAELTGAMTFALPGGHGSYRAAPASGDPFIHQETTEVLYHTLWESVHVFFEQRELGCDVGASQFLYPFLGSQKQDTSSAVAHVASSIEMKVHDDSELRAKTAQEEAAQIGAAVEAILGRIVRGGKLIVFGNGGSATDANDFALDCVVPPCGWQPIPAVSLALEPASL